MTNETNKIDQRMVYQVECPDRRDKEKEPQKRYKFEICVDSFLPIYPLQNPPIGAVVLAMCQMYAGWRYENIKDRNQIEHELGEKIGGFLKDTDPKYLRDVESWKWAIREAVAHTMNRTNNVWRSQQPVPQRPRSLRVRRTPPKLHFPFE